MATNVDRPWLWKTLKILVEKQTFALWRTGYPVSLTMSRSGARWYMSCSKSAGINLSIWNQPQPPNARNWRQVLQRLNTQSILSLALQFELKAHHQIGHPRPSGPVQTELDYWKNGLSVWMKLLESTLRNYCNSQRQFFEKSISHDHNVALTCHQELQPTSEIVPVWSLDNGVSHNYQHSTVSIVSLLGTRGGSRDRSWGGAELWSTFFAWKPQNRAHTKHQKSEPILHN